MKRKSREISIFSMSAMDLFASALGAFILLTVVMIPYFPNTGDSPERVADIKAELEDQKAARLAAEADVAALEAEAEDLEKLVEVLQAKSSLLPVDIIVALDTTGSMEDQVKGLGKDLKTLAKILTSISDSAALGVIDFKDACEGRRAVRVNALGELTPSKVSELDRFVSRMKAENYTDCNDTHPEAIDLALRAAINQPWRDEAKTRVIVITTDNAAFRNKWSQTFADAERFKASGGKVSTVFVKTQSTESEARGYLRNLSRRGGGNFVSEGGSFIGEVLVAAFS